MDELMEVSHPVTTAIQIINGTGVVGYLMRSLQTSTKAYIDEQNKNVMVGGVKSVASDPENIESSMQATTLITPSYRPENLDDIYEPGEEWTQSHSQVSQASTSPREVYTSYEETAWLISCRFPCSRLGTKFA
jgi:hypothetical protein